MNNNRQKFLKEFISNFFEKGVNRRTSQNTIGIITFQINKITKKQFHKNLTFSENEIIKAFKSSGYKIMNNYGREMDWYKFKNGTLLPETEFINIKSAKLKRLTCTNIKIKENWKPETKAEVLNLKQEIEAFWVDSGYIVD